MFLLANIFTGLTNVLIDTRAQPPLIGHLVMMVYLGTMCSVGYGIANNETVSHPVVIMIRSNYYSFRFLNIVDDSFLVDRKMWLHKACYLDSHFFCLQIVLQLVCNKTFIPPLRKKICWCSFTKRIFLVQDGVYFTPIKPA